MYVYIYIYMSMIIYMSNLFPSRQKELRTDASSHPTRCGGYDLCTERLNDGQDHSPKGFRASIEPYGALVVPSQVPLQRPSSKSQNPDVESFPAELDSSWACCPAVSCGKQNAAEPGTRQRQKVPFGVISSHASCTYGRKEPTCTELQRKCAYELRRISHCCCQSSILSDGAL